MLQNAVKRLSANEAAGTADIKSCAAKLWKNVRTTNVFGFIALPDLGYVSLRCGKASRGQTALQYNRRNEAGRIPDGNYCCNLRRSLAGGDIFVYSVANFNAPVTMKRVIEYYYMGTKLIYQASEILIIIH